jgi:hypothetical protein
VRRATDPTTGRRVREPGPAPAVGTPFLYIPRERGCFGAMTYVVGQVLEEGAVDQYLITYGESVDDAPHECIITFDAARGAWVRVGES